MSSDFNIKVFDAGSGVDVEAIKRVLGDLFKSSKPYGDASQTTLVQVEWKASVISEAMRRIRALGYQIDN